MSALVQGSQEWLDVRRSHIGASDMPIIMGDSPYKTAHQLWREKVGLDTPQQDTYILAKGKRLEPLARVEFERMTGIEVTPAVFFDNASDYWMASLDGISGDGKYIVELKYASKQDHEGCKKGKIPKRYYAQLQTQLEVLRLYMAYYFSFYEYTVIEDGEKVLKYEGVIVEVQRDDLYIAQMRSAAEEFKRCMDQMIPPAMTEKEKQKTRCIEVVDEFWEKKCEQVLKVKKQIKELEEQVKEIEEWIRQKYGGSNVLGTHFRLSKSLIKGRLDYDKAFEHYGIDIEELEQFRKPDTESWRITRNE